MKADWGKVLPIHGPFFPENWFVHIPTYCNMVQNTFTPSSTQFNKWATCYLQIRQAMIFLQMAPECLGDASNQDGYISVEEMRRMKSRCYILAAYNYFQLF